MASEMEPWQTILGRQKVERSVNSIEELTTPLYALPEKSRDFLRRSWREWQKLP